MTDTGARRGDHAKGLGGVSSLDRARDQVERAQRNVAQIAGRTGIGGGEGAALSRLFRAWDGEAEKVVAQISKMTRALEDNVTSAHRVALNNQELADSLTSKTSQGVFEALR